jgi:hypothetical protein
MWHHHKHGGMQNATAKLPPPLRLLLLQPLQVVQAPLRQSSWPET